MKTKGNSPQFLFFAISAADRQALLIVTKSLVRRIQQNPLAIHSILMESLKYHSQTPGSYRVVLILQSKEELVSKLEILAQKIESSQNKRIRWGDGVYGGEISTDLGKVAFMFPGFGAEYPGMMEGLLMRFPVAAKWLHLLEIIFFEQSREGIPLPERISRLESQLAEISFGLTDGGPAGSVVSLFYHEILKDLGVPCDMMVGHSNGENSAGVASGMLQYQSPELLIRILRQFQNPRIDSKAPEGSFYAVHNLSWEQVVKWSESMGHGVYPGMQNCNNQQIVFLLEESREAALENLRLNRGIAFPIPTEFPFHTTLFRPWAKVNRLLLDQLGFGPGNVPVYSCVDTLPFPDEEDAIKEKFARQWLVPVRFADCLTQMYKDGARIFVDCGPNNRLSGFGKDIFRGEDVLVLAANNPKKNKVETIFEACAKMWVKGYPIRLEGLMPEEFTSFAVLEQLKVEKPILTLPQPSSPASTRKRLFLEYQNLMRDFLSSQERGFNHLTNSLRQNPGNRSTPAPAIARFPQEAWPFLAQPARWDSQGMVVCKRISLSEYPLLRDHAMGKVLAVIPFTLSLEIVSEAAALFFQGERKVTGIKDARSHAWLALDNGFIDLEIKVQRHATREAGLEMVHVEIFEVNQAEQRALGFDAQVILKADYSHAGLPETDLQGAPREREITFDQYFEQRMFHGKLFKGIQRVLENKPKGLVANMQRADHANFFTGKGPWKMQIPGVLLDSTGQMMAYWLASGKPDTPPIFPYRLDKYEQFADFPDHAETLSCKAMIKVKFSGVEGTFEFFDSREQILARMTGFQLRFFDTEWIDRIVVGDWDGIPVAGLTEDLIGESGGIWGRTIVHFCLDQTERNAWKAQPSGSERLQTLQKALARYQGKIIYH